MRILVVDDSLMSCGVLVRMLASLFPDADTQYVTGGALALDFLEKNKTDIVLTDVDMPTMNGFELEKRIREKFPDVAVYFETGTTTDFMKNLDIPIGRCIFKPFFIEDLRKLLSNWLQ